MMQKSMFTIDGNGWACPYFTKEVADQTMTCSEPMMTYDANTDTYTYDNTYYFQGMDIARENLCRQLYDGLSNVWRKIK